MPDWLTDFFSGISALQLILWVIAIGAFVGFVIKLWPFLRKFVRTVDVVIQLSDALPKLQADVAMIRHEVLPNGGGSLKDQATRTEAAVDTLTKEVAHVRRQQASTKTTLARTEKTLTEHINATKE